MRSVYKPITNNRNLCPNKKIRFFFIVQIYHIIHALCYVICSQLFFCLFVCFWVDFLLIPGACVVWKLRMSGWVCCFWSVIWCLLSQVSGDVAGVPAGIHGSGQASAGSERALRKDLGRVWEEVGEWDVSRLAGGFVLRVLSSTDLIITGVWEFGFQHCLHILA